VVVPPGVGGCERVAVGIVRLRTDQMLEPRVEERMHGAVETLLRERLGLARARAEAGAPKQPLRLRQPKFSPVDGSPHRRIVAFRLDHGIPEKGV
jgi:hypothetical protein